MTEQERRSSFEPLVRGRDDTEDDRTANCLSKKQRGAVGGEATDEVKHGLVVLGFFTPACEDAAKAIEPTMGAFDYPAADFLTGSLSLGGSFLALRADVGDEAVGLEEGAHLIVVVALVQAGVLRVRLGRLGPVDRDALDGRFKQLEVVAVGSSHRERDGHAATSPHSETAAASASNPPAQPTCAPPRSRERQVRHRAVAQAARIPKQAGIFPHCQRAEEQRRLLVCPGVQRVGLQLSR